MHQRFHLRHVNQRHQLLLAAMAQQILKQARLRGFYELRHSDGRVDVCHRVVGVAVLDAVGPRQVLEPEARQAVVVLRPVNSLRAQRIAGAHDIQQIPARIAVLPAPGIGIVEVAVEDIARHFIVKTDVVVTHHAGIRHREQVVDATGKFCFANAFIPRFLRGDARHHHRARLRQIVIGGFTVKHLGFADDVKFVIGSDSRKLRRSVQRRMGTKGFVIVEQKSRARGRVRHQ